MKKLIIVGAGGFGLEVAAYAEDAQRVNPGHPEIAGFIDDTKPKGATHAGYSILGNTDDPLDPNALYILAVGFPDGRRRLAEKFEARGASFHTLVHPMSYVARTARLEDGCIIVPFATVGPEVVLGAHCMLNHYAVVGHEARTGAYTVLCPHASVHGGAQLGEEVFLGSGAYVTARIKVGDKAKISAGAVVYNDVPAGALALGNPAAFRS